ncbi:MAG TPA: hypothetical protein VHU40_10740 [Polyangia bacterium]|nr:hypothetical protein [Polyangia bacterium]
MTIKQSALVLVSFALSVAAVGCGTTRYGYRPATVAASSEAGFPASRYGVPAQSPAGEAFVTSFGTRDEGTSAGNQLIHVRLAVSNQSSPATWSIDPAQLTLAAPGGAPQRPDFMEIDGRQNGSTDIPRGQRKVLDLYYRVPGGAPDVRAVPTFDFAWQVNLGDTAFSEHTPFQREPYVDYQDATNRRYVAVGAPVPWWWGWYGPPLWGPYGAWGYGYPPYYYGYGPRVGFGFGVGVHGYGGPRYYGGGGFRGGGGFQGGHGRVAPTVRGRAH